MTEREIKHMNVHPQYRVCYHLQDIEVQLKRIAEDGHKMYLIAEQSRIDIVGQLTRIADALEYLCDHTEEVPEDE